MNLLESTLTVSALFLMSISSVYAQDEPATTSPTTFGGSADFYYRYDFANIDGNSLTSFTNSHDSFQIGMASIEASHKLGKASVFVDLGFGSRASEFTYNDAANTFMIKQLNMTYDFSDKFRVTVGSFSTHIGYELVDSVDNKNYSMSYAFTKGPFFNTGVKAQYTSGKFSFMAGVTNPTDFKTATEAGTKQKTFIGQVGYVVDSGTLFLNFTSGSTNPSPAYNVSQIDIVATRKVSDKFALGFNGTYAMIKDDNLSANDANWFSAIGYLSYALNAKASLAYRLEYFDDKDGFALGVNDNNVIANTLSLNYKEGNFTFIPEVRFDAAGKDVFKKSNGNATGSAASILLATTYSF
ncbi:outer membrane beta-barrel protein [Flavobacterium sp.]|uniref:outer membrane beta-barrel protein n=1 Tax=Flavobacterium sp. TaxID=239 RepID=UPI0037530451